VRRHAGLTRTIHDVLPGALPARNCRVLCPALECPFDKTAATGACRDEGYPKSNPWHPQSVTEPRDRETETRGLRHEVETAHGTRQSETEDGAR
jgi:hypothetical protein